MKKPNRFLILLAGLLVLTGTACGGSDAHSDSSISPYTLPYSVPCPDSTGADESGTPASENSDVSEETQEDTSSEENASSLPSLKDFYGEHGMKAGTCLTPQMVSNPVYSALIKEQFNSITMENAMKPDSIFNKTQSTKTGELVVELSRDVIKMLDFAKANDMAVRGHTFVWYSQTPEWIFHEDFNLKKDLVSREVLLERMESMMQQMFALLEEGGYSDLFYAYDVVNEAWMEDGSMRENKWSTIIGDDYLWYAFYYADKYAPENIDLYYNDYNEQFKGDTLVKFVNTLVDENGEYLIDGIGLQAHLYTQDDLNSYFKTMDKLAETGLKLQLTELDVCLGAWQNTLEASEKNLKVQGRYYYNLVNGILERVDAGTISMDALTFWGFADHLSWRREASPLLFDRNCEPKYAFYGAMQMKEEAGF